jgi:MurNAc alpha-1-phosphate uridylyltransferase
VGKLKKAMILAAGMGTRMRPLTKAIPKPLVPLAGKPLITYSLERIQGVGIKEVVINLGYKGALIQEYVRDGRQWGISVQYTKEQPESLLGAGGGVKNALPYLGEDRFLLVSADIWTDYPLEKLCAQSREGFNTILGVDNPAYHTQGDFTLRDGQLSPSLVQPHNSTFAGIGVFSPHYFTQVDTQVFSLMPVIKASITQQHCHCVKIARPYQHVNIGTVRDLIYAGEKMQDEVLA